MLPNRGHAVQFLVIIYGHGRSVTKFSASKGLDLDEGSFKFAVRMSFAAEWSKRHCGGSVVILLHPVTSSYLFLAFQGTWVHVLQSVSGEGPHTLSRATFSASKLGPSCNENLAASEHPSITGHLRSFDKLGFIR